MIDAKSNSPAAETLFRAFLDAGLPVSEVVQMRLEPHRFVVYRPSTPPSSRPVSPLLKPKTVSERVSDQKYRQSCERMKYKRVADEVLGRRTWIEIKGAVNAD